MRVAARALALALLVTILVAVPASAKSVRFDESEETPSKSPPLPVSAEASRVHSAKRADAAPTPREPRVVATGEDSADDVPAGDAPAEGNATAPTGPQEENPPDTKKLGRWWWGGWYGWKGWWGYYSYPYYTSYWCATRPLSRPPSSVPTRPLDSSPSTPPPCTPAPPLLLQRILELRVQLLQVRGREGPRVCARDDRRGRRGARGEGISRSRTPPARCARIHASRVVETNGRGDVVRRVAGRRGGVARGGALERRREGRRVLLALGLRAGGLRGVRRGGWRRVLRPGLGAPGRVLMVRATQEGTE
jgi:hypothetical protein